MDSKKLLLGSLLALSLTSCKYSQSEYDVAVNNAYSDGVDIGEELGFENGYQKGNSDGFAAGYAQGLLDAGNLDYNDGYANGKLAGLVEGEAIGYSKGYIDGDAAGYNEGYGHGFDDGFGDGYSIGYKDGDIDGYNDGYNDGYYDGDIDGFNDGYLIGEADGYSNGLDDGYDFGFGDGYEVGYDDGWYDAGGSSSEKSTKAQKIASTLLNDLIDFSTLKSPKAVLSDPVLQEELLSATAASVSDSLTKKAMLDNYLINSVKNQLIQNFGLNEKRSLLISKLSSQMITAQKTGETSITKLNNFSKSVLGTTMDSVQKAFKQSIQGDSVELNKIIEKAAQLNEITPEHTTKIMGQLFF